MSKVTMPEPVAFVYGYRTGEPGIVLFEGASLDPKSPAPGLEDWFVQKKVITTDQAEAYAQAVRREALEEVVSLLESRFFKDQMQIERAIRALIQQEQS